MNYKFDDERMPCGCYITNDGYHDVPIFRCEAGKALSAQELAAYDRAVMRGLPEDKAALDAAHAACGAHFGFGVEAAALKEG